MNFSCERKGSSFAFTHRHWSVCVNATPHTPQERALTAARSGVRAKRVHTQRALVGSTCVRGVLGGRRRNPAERGPTKRRRTCQPTPPPPRWPRAAFLGVLGTNPSTVA